METRANHVLIGAFTLLAAGLALLFGLWASKYTTDRAWQDYEVHFTQAVTGLSVGSTVRYNGIPVGTLRELFLHPDDPRQVVARIRLEAGTPIREDTVASLALAGLTGVTFIQLTGGSPESPPLTSRRGELPQIEADDSALAKLMALSEDIATQSFEIIERLAAILSEENAERIAHTLSNIDEFTSLFVAESESISAVIEDSRRAAESIADTMASAERAIERFDGSLEQLQTGLLESLPEMSEDLREAARRLSTLLGRTDRILAENEAAMAAFGAEGLTQLGPTLQDLRVLIRDLNRLSARFERNPARFLLGQDPLEEYSPQ